MSVDTRHQSGLSEEDIARFERDGYLVIDNPCPPEFVDAVLEEMDPVLRDDSHPAKDRREDGVEFISYPGHSEIDYHWRRIKNAWVFSESVRRLALYPKILAIVVELVGHGRSVMPFQTLNFPVGTEQPVHYDSMAFESDPPGYMCGVWVALEDVGMDNGPLIYYPGSHKLPALSQREIEDTLGEPLVRSQDFSENREFVGRRSGQYTAYSERLIEKHALEPAYGTIKKGQALLWHANLMHGGAPMRDPSSTRHSQVTHYFFEGCRVFYTPFWQEGDHIFWAYAYWIRDPVPEYSTELLHDTIRSHVADREKVVIATRGEDELTELDGPGADHFPGGGHRFDDPEITDQLLIERLEAARAEGVKYAVFPRRELVALPKRFPEFQDHLENHYSGILRDGFVCAIYELSDQEQNPPSRSEH